MRCAFARRALALAEQAGDERLLARAHVRSADLEVVLGLVADPIARFGRALELGDRVPVDAENSARSMLAVCLIRAGRLDEARPYLTTERERATAEGDEASFCWVSLFLAELEWFAGRWDAAQDCATEALEVAEQAGLRMRAGGLHALVALVEASRGDPERARVLATRAIAILDDVNEVAYGNYARQMLAFLDLSLGNAAAARKSSTPTRRSASRGSKRLAFIGDAIEALGLLGEAEQAASLASELAARGAQLHRPPLVATAARCRALILGAKGDLDGAIAAAEEAVAMHERLGLPFERARSLLVLGEVQRRAKQRRAARETLTAAIAAFDALGAHLWVAKAEAERAPIGGRTSIEGLSATELRVAQLVAEGRTNKEVAAALFVSVRAVESNLSKVYAKLGSSRGRSLPGGSEPGRPCHWPGVARARTVVLRTFNGAQSGGWSDRQVAHTWRSSQMQHTTRRTAIFATSAGVVASLRIRGARRRQPARPRLPRGRGLECRCPGHERRPPDGDDRRLDPEAARRIHRRRQDRRHRVGRPRDRQGAGGDHPPGGRTRLQPAARRLAPAHR